MKCTRDAVELERKEDERDEREIGKGGDRDVVNEILVDRHAHTSRR